MTQERSNSYRTAADRVRNGYERLSNRSILKDKERLLKNDRKNKQTIKNDKKKTTVNSKEQQYKRHKR